MPDATLDQRVATGFHRNTFTNREGGANIKQFRVEQMIDRAATVGTVWLGLTFGCAQCHDHFQSLDAMLKEFDRAIGKLGMKGILLYSNLDGKFPDEPAYRPLYAEAERRNTPILRMAPSEYLKRVYLDTVSPIPMAIRYGIDFVGVDRMLYSSDHPWVDPSLIAGHVESLKLSADDQAKVFTANAKRLLIYDFASHHAGCFGSGHAGGRPPSQALSPGHLQ